MSLPKPFARLKTRDARSLRRFLAPSFTVLVGVFLLTVPSTAHAQGLLDSVFNFSASVVTDGLIAVLQVVQQGLAWLAIQIMSSIEVVLAWQNVKNNVVIQGSWEIARDLCNMLFIVGLVLISFATIFRTLNIGPLQNFYWRTALPRLLVAAILINLSLGLSQGVVAISNKVTTTFTGVLSGTLSQFGRIMDSAELATSLYTVTDAQVASRNLGLNLSSKAPDGTSWDIYLTHEENRTAEENEAFDKCLNESVDIGVLEGIGNWFSDEDPPRKSLGQCTQELAMKRRGERPVSFLERVGVEAGAVLQEYSDKSKPEQGASLLISAFMQVVFTIMLIIALGSALIFFVLRVVALWVLMAFSAFAFGLNWIPGFDSLGKWWRQFLGWNMFGPFYLLVLIFGMAFLVRAGDLTSSLNAVGASPGLPAALIGTLLKYVLALIVFVGGLGLALNSSFATAIKSTPVIGGAAQRLGAFSALTASAALGRRTWAGTGVPSTFQATKERLAQGYSQARPEAIRVKSDEERLATARRRLGVFGGAQAEQQALSKRVSSTQSQLKDKLATIDKGQQDDWLRGQMNSRDQSTKLAARQILLERGKLRVDKDRNEIAETKNLYPEGLARSEFDKSINKAAVNDPDSVLSYRLDELEGSQKFKDMSEGDQGQARDDLVTKYYSAALNNSEAFGKLDKKYFEAGSEQFDKMKKTIDSRFPSDKPRARASAFQRLSQSIDDPEKNRALKQWFASSPEPTESPDEAA